jgi:signal transduction histidine kinase
MPRRAPGRSAQELEALLSGRERELAHLRGELAERDRALSEALEQRTATGEILRVVSRSPTDLQRVLDTIVQSAARLTDAERAIIQQVDGGLLRNAAIHAPAMADRIAEGLGLAFPVERTAISGRAVLERRTVRIEDAARAVEEEYPGSRAAQQRFGYRSAVTVPLLREGEALGTLAVHRGEVRPFTDQEVTLLETFADQAVIAIENARLFAELQERLEEQTVTAEVLRVIGRSPTDLQAVLDTIVQSAARLCASDGAVVFRVDGDTYRAVARTTGERLTLEAPGRVTPLSREEGIAGRAMIDGEIVHIHDLAAVPVDELASPYPRSRGVRTLLSVPLLRQGLEVGAIGAINVTRLEVRPFTEREIALLETFADQAVIAIENARLFAELQDRTAELSRSVERLTALFEVGQAVGGTLDLDRVLAIVVARAAELAGADGGAVYEYDPDAGVFELRATHRMSAEFVAAIRQTRIRLGETVIGHAAAERAPVQLADILAEDADARTRAALERAGYRAVLSVPLLREGAVVGALVVRRTTPGAFDAETVALVQTFATQSALAIQNARLFAEIEEKSRQLEEASRHKSEFLANMSHELRTPLNAVIGFTEVLLERYFGDLNEKQEDYLKDVLSSGQHLLSLINDILDLSKVEAGRMDLELSTFDLGSVLEAGLVMVKERASRKGVELTLQVATDTGRIEADERKVKQVLFNLLTNAVKFTPEGGEITASAQRKDGGVEVAVADTGVGIAPEEQARVFEEFGQARSATGQSEGTGLGLALCKRFVELHGGTISVASEVGRGSTFTVSLPVRQPAPPVGSPGQP